VPKKEELEKIIRGKGLEALRPTTESFSSEKITSEDPTSESKIHSSFSNSKGEEIPYRTDETTKEHIMEKLPLNENCLISAIIPTLEQQLYIQDMLGKDTHRIFIWDVYISQEAQRSSVFRNATPLTFNICCTASGLIAQLKPEFKLHWISYDITNMQIQPFYKFSVCTKPLWNNFKVQFQINPAAPGFFNFHVIIDLESAGLFWVKEGFVFKIVEAN